MASRPLCLVPAPLALLREGPPAPPRSLDALLACARAGDAWAFHHLRRRLEARLVHYVRRFAALDDDTADDVVHETFTAAWGSLERIHDAQHLKPWLFRVARYKAISALRRRGPRGAPLHSLDYAAEHGADHADVRLPDPLRQAMTSDAHRCRAEAVRRAIARLPPTYVAVMRLYYLEDLGTRQVAELLDLPRTTVKMRLMRGRQRLRALVLEELGGRDPEA